MSKNLRINTFVYPVEQGTLACPLHKVHSPPGPFQTEVVVLTVLADLSDLAAFGHNKDRSVFLQLHNCTFALKFLKPDELQKCPWIIRITIAF
jgi:hypothetical protein